MATATKPKKKPAAKPPAKKAAKPGGKKPAAKKKAAAAHDEWNSPEYLAAYDSETMTEVTRYTQDIGRLKMEHEAAHNKAIKLSRELKERTEERELYLRERDATRGQKPNHLFAEAERQDTLDKAKARAGDKVDDKKKAQQVNAGEPAGKTKLAGWFPEDIHQRYPLANWIRYGLQQKDVDALAAGKCKTGGDFGPIDTVGRLAEYQTPNATGWARKLTDVQGIGPKAQERIEDASVRFWADWRSGVAEDFARSLGYVENKGAADADAPAAGGSGKGGKAQGGGGKGKPGSAKRRQRKPSGSPPAEKLINDLAGATAVPDDDRDSWTGPDDPGADAKAEKQHPTVEPAAAV